MQSAADVMGLDISVLHLVQTAEWVTLAQQMSDQQLNHVILDKQWNGETQAVDPVDPGLNATLQFSDMWDTPGDLFDNEEDFDVELGGDEPDPQEDGVAGIFTVSNSFGHTQEFNSIAEDIVVFTYPTDSYVGGRMTLHIRDNTTPTPNSMVREYLFVNNTLDASINAQGTRVLAGGEQITDAQTADIIGGEVNLKIQTTTAWTIGDQFSGKLIIELIAM